MSRRLACLVCLLAGCLPAPAASTSAPADAREMDGSAAAEDRGPSVCVEVCAAKLTVACAQTESPADCARRCQAEEAGACGTEAQCLNRCLHGLDDPWLCIPSLGTAIRSQSCPDQQEAYVACRTGRRRPAGERCGSP